MEEAQFLQIKLHLPEDSATYGFHLIRNICDPYPQVEKVEEGSGALQGGVQTGDHVIDMNGQSLLGLGINSILQLVKASTCSLTLSIWRPCSENRNFNIINTILTLISCPVCASSVAKLPRQCRNGHLICTACVMKMDKCPICRAPLGRPHSRALPGARSLLAEQLTSALQSAGYVVPCKSQTRFGEQECEMLTNEKRLFATKDKRKVEFTKRLADCWKRRSTSAGQDQLHAS